MRIDTILWTGVTVYFAATNYTSYWGPTHPTSATPALDDDVVEWMWSGAVTPTSVTVRARTADPADAVRLVVGRGPELAAAVRSAPAASSTDDQRVVALTVAGLRPDTAYDVWLPMAYWTNRRGGASTTGSSPRIDPWAATRRRASSMPSRMPASSAPPRRA